MHCYNKGVLDRHDKLRLYLHENATEDQIKWSTGSTLLSGKNNINIETFIEIEVIDLVEFIKEMNKQIKLLKMDVEGVECQIINKLIDTGIIRNIEYLLVETHDKKNPHLKEQTDRLRQRIINEKLTNINLNWY